MKNLMMACSTLVLVACSGEIDDTNNPTDPVVGTPTPVPVATPTPVVTPAPEPTPVVTPTPTFAVNLALSKTATQSSTDFNGEAARAVDGNTDGAYRNNSITHTEVETQPWWQVDLGAVEYLSHINIFNRTDNCCSNRLSDFYLLVSKSAFESSDLNETISQTGVVSYYFGSVINESATFEVEFDARYVRVQLLGSENPLSLAEVEIMSDGEQAPEPTTTPAPVVTPAPVTTPAPTVTPTTTPEPTVTPIPTTSPSPTTTPAPVATPEPGEPITGDPAQGELLYKSNEQGCLTCHGADSEPPTPLTPIDITTTTYSRNGLDYTLESYIERFMPLVDVTICDEQCSADIAAYIRTWTPPNGGSDADDSDLFSSIVRLTNDEYYTALIDLLLPENDDRSELLKQIELSDELEIGGLVSAEERQQLSQITFSRFLEAAKEAANLRLLGDNNGTLTLDNFNAFILCSEPSMSHNDCIRERGLDYITRGFRGQATETDTDNLDSLLAAFDALPDTDNNDSAVLDRLVLRYQSVVQFVALSPKFVMLIEKGIEAQDNGIERPLTEYEIANRLSFFIAGTPPDKELSDAAESGFLSNSEERLLQASRLISNEDTSKGAEKIVVSWLGLNPLLASETAISETQTFISDWISERRPFTDLYTSVVAVENIDSTVTQEPFGILGLEAVIASHTNDPVPSFINRGEFIVADLLCGQLPADIPDEAIADTVEDPVEVFEAHGKEPCATCHVVFDNYGAAMQRFDSVSFQYDATNDWLGSNFNLFPIGDVSGTVNNVEDLSSVLGASYQAHSCFAELWYRHAVRRDMLSGNDTADDAILDSIVLDWLEGDTSVASLLELIASHESFTKLYR